eukprot:3173043-Rhodomonas_salina.2
MPDGAEGDEDEEGTWDLEDEGEGCAELEDERVHLSDVPCYRRGDWLGCKVVVESCELEPDAWRIDSRCGQDA